MRAPICHRFSRTSPLADPSGVEEVMCRFQGLKPLATLMRPPGEEPRHHRDSLKQSAPSDVWHACCSEQAWWMADGL